MGDRRQRTLDRRGGGEIYNRRVPDRRKDHETRAWFEDKIDSFSCVHTWPQFYSVVSDAIRIGLRRRDGKA